MKRIVAVLSALMLAVVMVGCAGKQISGTPSEVVKDCQGIATDASAEVTVTGYLRGASKVEISDKGSLLVTLVDSDDPFDMSPSVSCFIANPSESIVEKINSASRLTISGKLDTKYIRDTYVTITDATVH